MQIAPSQRLVRLALAWTVLAGGAAFVPFAREAWIATGLAGALIVAIDAIRAYAIGPLAIERTVAPALALGVFAPVVLAVRNEGDRRASVELFDHYPPSFDTRTRAHAIDLPPGHFAKIEYEVCPRERGDAAFTQTDLRIASPLGLLRRIVRIRHVDAVRIYPNYRAVMKYSLLATDNRTSQLGIRKRPRRGEGLDFHQLREYRDGDSLRQIDWRATSRLGKVISREYQDERDQQIVFLVDCGRKMHAKDGELSHFDHALNAVLLLTHVALRQGDAVGLLTFSGTHRWLSPRKGTAHLNAIMNAVYDLETSARPSDYLEAARGLAHRVKKRALVVLVTNLRDEDQGELVQALGLLRRTHLVLVASLREQVLDAVVADPPDDLDGAIDVAATHRYLSSRKRAHERLGKTGALVLDTVPAELPVALVNGYLDIKSRRVL